MKKKLADLTLKEIETICKKNSHGKDKVFACQGCPLEFKLENDLGYKAMRCVLLSRLYKQLPENWHVSKFRKEVEYEEENT